MYAHWYSYNDVVYGCTCPIPEATAHQNLAMPYKELNFSLFITLYQSCHNLVTRLVQCQKYSNFITRLWHGCQGLENNNVNKASAWNVVLYYIYIAILLKKSSKLLSLSFATINHSFIQIYAHFAYNIGYWRWGVS